MDLSLRKALHLFLMLIFFALLILSSIAIAQRESKETQPGTDGIPLLEMDGLKTVEQWTILLIASILIIVFNGLAMVFVEEVFNMPTYAKRLVTGRGSRDITEAMFGRRRR